MKGYNINVFYIPLFQSKVNNWTINNGRGKAGSHVKWASSMGEEE